MTSTMNTAHGASVTPTDSNVKNKFSQKWLLPSEDNMGSPIKEIRTRILQNSRQQLT